jgi:hypothetical protein
MHAVRLAVTTGKDRKLFLMTSGMTGTLLSQLVQTEAAEDELLSQVQLRAAAEEVVRYAASLRMPILWPVGDGGQRLAGAATLLADDGLECLGWRSEMRDRDVVIVATVGVSPVAIERALALARTRGARRTYVCAADHRLSTPNADAFHLVTHGSAGRELSA